MGVGGAFNTALGGLSAYGNQVGYISDNLANVSTPGFKRVDATFQSYVTLATQTIDNPGGVNITPSYRNTLAGQVSGSDNPTSFAISEGNGFAPVAVPTSTAGGKADFSNSLPHYTRACDFTEDTNGYLVNSSGQYLQGIKENTTYKGDIPGTPSLSELQGVRVDPTIYKSIPGAASSVISYNANYPAGALSSGVTPEAFNPNTPDILGGWSIPVTQNMDNTVGATTGWSIGTSGTGAAATYSVAFMDGSGKMVTSASVSDFMGATINMNDTQIASAQAMGAKGFCVYANGFLQGSTTFPPAPTGNGVAVAVHDPGVSTGWYIPTSGTGTTSYFTARFTDANGKQVSFTDPNGNPISTVVMKDKAGAVLQMNPWDIAAAQEAGAVSVSFYGGPQNNQETLQTTMTLDTTTYPPGTNANPLQYTTSIPLATGGVMPPVPIMPPLFYRVVYSNGNGDMVGSSEVPANGSTVVSMSAAQVAAASAMGATSFSVYGCTKSGLERLQGSSPLPATPALTNCIIDPSAAGKFLAPDAVGQSSSQVNSQTQFFDSLGNSHTLQITYQKVPVLKDPVTGVNASPFVANDANAWEVVSASVLGVADKVFGTTDLQVPCVNGTLVTFTENGTLNNTTNISTGSVSKPVFNIPWSNAASPPGSGVAAAPPRTDVVQPITIDFGSPPTATTSATGSTQFAGTALEVRSVEDTTGQAPGDFQKASIDNNGYVVFSYSNGDQLKPYRIPLITFSNANKLDRITGAVFGGNDTLAGKPIARWSGEGDTGTIVASSTEASNVDIADELTQMIVAQRAYSSNGKVITTADQMIQEALGLVH